MRTRHSQYSMARSGSFPKALAVVLVTGFAGFGIKAGVMPLHVWLPGAHANAPSHVSALMSGVLIKMGIYGLCRTCSLFPHPPLWWGAVILGLGAIDEQLQPGGVGPEAGEQPAPRIRLTPLTPRAPFPTQHQPAQPPPCDDATAAG